LTVLLAFDLMGTLLSDPFRTAHEAATGWTLTELMALDLAAVYHDLESGRLTESEYWRWLRRAGVGVDVDLFHAVCRAGYDWLPGMRDLLTEWSARHLTVVASNCPPWIEPTRERMFAGLAVSWYPSYRWGVRKPSGDFFRGLCASAGTTVECLILVDDKPVNTRAVRALHGRAVTFTSAADTHRELTELLTSLD
jgi:FMN hydrolase / 5-amino-6-(5-phospho-D-ribitylamino)uracil phosphatase